jgi:hypothetical protein
MIWEENSRFQSQSASQPLSLQKSESFVLNIVTSLGGNYSSSKRQGGFNSLGGSKFQKRGYNDTRGGIGNSRYCFKFQQA